MAELGKLIRSGRMTDGNGVMSGVWLKFESYSRGLNVSFEDVNGLPVWKTHAWKKAKANWEVANFIEDEYNVSIGWMQQIFAGGIFGTWMIRISDDMWAGFMPQQEMPTPYRREKNNA